ncbi:MAG: CRISPR-associated endonuclease Cas1 [Chromatiales bacterium]
MSTLVLDRSNLEIRQDGGALAMYENGERRGTVPLAPLERVVLQGTIRLDTGVLTRLAEQGIATVLLSRRQSRRVAILLGPAHNDVALRLAQMKAALDAAWCAGWARRVVTSKLRAQRRLLRGAVVERPDLRKPLTDGLEVLDTAMITVRQEGLTIHSVRGIEGAAAAAHYRGLTALFPDHLGFHGRNRRPPRDPVNACLSLGYTLLHFEAVRACHAAGLDPLIGFYHRPAFGRESLACDLIELLRPRVDRWVWERFRNRRLRAEHFTHDKGACLLHKAGREAFYQEYQCFATLPRRLLRRQCAQLARSFRTAGMPLIDSATDRDSED